MTHDEFLLAMDRVLELPEGSLKGNENLDDLESWNSLAMVEYIALADTNGSKLSPRQIRDCNTVKDLAQLARIQ